MLDITYEDFNTCYYRGIVNFIEREGTIVCQIGDNDYWFYFVDADIPYDEFVENHGIGEILNMAYEYLTSNEFKTEFTDEYDYYAAVIKEQASL